MKSEPTSTAVSKQSLLEIASHRKGSDAAESLRRILNGDANVTLASELRPDPKGNRSRRTWRKDAGDKRKPAANR